MTYQHDMCRSSCQNNGPLIGIHSWCRRQQPLKLPGIFLQTHLEFNPKQIKTHTTADSPKFPKFQTQTKLYFRNLKRKNYTPHQIFATHNTTATKKTVPNNHISTKNTTK